MQRPIVSSTAILQGNFAILLACGHSLDSSKSAFEYRRMGTETLFCKHCKKATNGGFTHSMHVKINERKKTVKIKLSDREALTLKHVLEWAVEGDKLTDHERRVANYIIIEL